MKHWFRLVIAYFLLFSVSFSSGQDLTKTIIAFGSCANENEDQPILQKVADLRPDFFIYLGDNIYGDTYDMSMLKAKYQKLNQKPEFKSLNNATKILATWDDHDFGTNDSGRHYPFIAESKQIFLDFFNEPKDSNRRKRAGIYTSFVHEVKGRKVQIILLDTRTFRDNLRNYRGEVHNQAKYFYPLDYYFHEQNDSTILGNNQWRWLEDQLLVEADIRIIGSSTQFGIEFNGYEAWANFPHEQQKMFNIIRKTKANGVIFISGDVHYSEISEIKPDGFYPIYDFTSSGITSTWHFATPNKNRIEGPVMDNHYGKITIDWSLKDPEIKMENIDIKGNQRFEFSFPLSRIKF